LTLIKWNIQLLPPREHTACHHYSCWLWQGCAHNYSVWYILWLLQFEGSPDVSRCWLLTATSLGSYNQSTIKPLHQLRQSLTSLSIMWGLWLVGRTDGRTDGCCT